MKAIVLCGGKGTRLRPYTLTIPKPMLLIGRKPLLEYTIEHLRFEGIRDIVFTVGHLKEQITDYFGDGKKFGVDIQYSEEGVELGTAGSLLNAKKLVPEENFLVLMGDQLTNVNLVKIMTSHKSHKALATIALKRMSMPSQFGAVKINEKNRVTDFVEKPVIQNLVNSGIYAFNKKIFEYLPKQGDFALDVFPKLLEKNKTIYGYTFDEYWIDIGTLSEYEQINETISLMDLITHMKR